MKKGFIPIVLSITLLGCSGSEKPVEPSDEVKNGPKLTKEQAQQYKDIIPGSKQFQRQSAQGQK